MLRFLNVYTISAFAALGGMLLGIDISSMSGIISQDQYLVYYNNPLGILQGTITSMMSAGSIVGALLCGIISGRLSRKSCIQLGAALWIIGSTLQSASNGVPMLIVGRVIAGLGIGMTSTLVPVYQSEIAPRKIRGRIVSFQQFAITWGILIGFVIEYGCSYLNSSAVFRIPWAIQTVPGIVLLIGLFWFPYSPRWLASQERWDEVLTVLALLRSAENDINDPYVLAEYKEIEDHLRLEQEEQATHPYRELFSRKMRKRVFLSMAIQVWSQLTGVPLWVYYDVYVYESVGFDNPLLATAIQYIIYMVMTIPCILWTDKWGRRPSLILGAAFISFLMFLKGGLFKRFGEPSPVLDLPYTWIVVGHPNVSRAIAACCYLAMATFAVSWGPIALMYPPEIVPVRIRAMSVALVTASNWTVNFALGLAVPPLLRSIQWRLLMIFGAFNFAASIHVWLAVPETKHRTLEELDEIFEHGEPLWRSLVGPRESSKLDSLARDIEVGALRINHLTPIETPSTSNNHV
ncbi:general substrate transporter [Lipomyces chichibuensis]|uniref:general substrate transporter n=1 Tax=Lipomyces chichibuensis TaxID=1546026 RepID=UPI0033430B9B